MKHKRTKHKRLPIHKIVVIVQRIRGRTNRQWMALLNLALSAKPRQARKILQQITKNDQEVTKWLNRV